MSALHEFLAERGEQILECLLQHVYLTVVAMSLAIIIAVPVGLVLTRSRRLAAYVIAGVGVIQTLPSLALVGLMVPLLGAGPKAAITALFLYALLPIVRNTYTGVMNVDPPMIEAARGMGMSSMQILFKIQLPLSVPVIMAGVRTSTIICVGVATLGGIVNAGGLGLLIWIGIDRSNDALIYAGAFPAMGLALALDYVLALGEKAFTPEGLGLTANEQKQSA
jgi:osmoprotectant transport system permease protein